MADENRQWELEGLLRGGIPPGALDAEELQGWKKYAKLILPHLGLILISCLYIVVGAAIFYHLEQPHEVSTRARSVELVAAQRARFLERMWEYGRHVTNDDFAVRDSDWPVRKSDDVTLEPDWPVRKSDDEVLESDWSERKSGDVISERDWRRRASEDVERITRFLFEAFDNSYVTAAIINHGDHVIKFNNSRNGGNWNEDFDNGRRQDFVVKDHWSFIAALFFTATLLTTIGYGNLVPVTFEGRLFCICYGLFGVPLILITIADIGKFLSEHIIWLYGKYSASKGKLKRTIQTKCRNANCCRCYQRRRQSEKINNISSNQTQDANFGGNFEPGSPPPIPSPNYDTYVQVEGAEKLNDGNSEHLQISQNEDAKKELSQNDDDAKETQEDHDTFNFDELVSIPVTLVLIILVTYTSLGALLLSTLEGWTLFDAFYFCFITMTTVGFGDLVPQKEAYFLLDLLYIVIGLAITTMCIDLVGVQYICKIHYFGRAMKDARYALVNVGGKMIQVADLSRYAALLHKKYGLNHPDANVLENPLHRLFPHAYIPKDIKCIRYIDHLPSSESLSSLTTTMICLNNSANLAASGGTQGRGNQKRKKSRIGFRFRQSFAGKGDELL